MNAHTPPGLLRDLSAVNIHVTNIWDLVNSQSDYRAAIPVLIDWLESLDERIPNEDKWSVWEGIVRALTVPWARPVAAEVMIDQFRKVNGGPGFGYRWVVGNALSVVADDSVFDELESLVRDRGFGRARQMIVFGLGRSKDPRVISLLIDLLGDEDVLAHAVMAIGKLKVAEARSAIESLLEHPKPLVRREAKKALAKILKVSS